MKPKIYIETSFISYLTSRTSRDLVTAARQQLTTDWWETKKTQYNLFVSQPVISEASDGDKQASKKRITVLNYGTRSHHIRSSKEPGKIIRAI